MSEPPPRDTDDTGSTTPVRERVNGYYRNGVWVPRDTEPDPQPPGWREAVEERLGVRFDDRRLWVVAGAVLLVLVVVVALVSSRSTDQPPTQEQDFLHAVRD